MRSNILVNIGSGDGPEGTNGSNILIKMQILPWWKCTCKCYLQNVVIGFWPQCTILKIFCVNFNKLTFSSTYIWFVWALITSLMSNILDIIGWGDGPLGRNAILIKIQILSSMKMYLQKLSAKCHDFPPLTHDLFGLLSSALAFFSLGVCQQKDLMWFRLSHIKGIVVVICLFDMQAHTPLHMPTW